MCVQKPKNLRCHSTLCFESRSLTSLELANWDGLAGEQQGVCLPGFPSTVMHAHTTMAGLM